MFTTKICFKLIGITLSAAFILSACNTAATTVAPVPILPSQTASSLPVGPTATATTAPVATETPIPTAVVTAVAHATSIVQSVAQVVPTVNAYCRKGPGTDYDQITYLISGTAYNVVGRNSLNTWWLVQVPGTANCWTGALGTNQLGPVAQAPVVLVPPAILPPSTFVNSSTCDLQAHTLDVTFNWSLVAKTTGYRLFRNGVLLVELGPTVTSFDDNAPLKMDLVYALEAFTPYETSTRVLTKVSACR